MDILRDVADLSVVRSAGEYEAALPGVEVMFLNDVRSTFVRQVGPGRLRWVQSSGLGVDALLTPEVISQGVTVTVSRGVCERPIAEWVLAAILLFVKDLRATIDLQRGAQWVHRESLPLSGRRVVVLGAGPVGAEIVSLLRSVGMDVQAVARRSRVEEALGQVRGLDELDLLLPEADDVVLALPLNASTRGLIGSDRLRRLKRGAHIVNVGRGPLVDESGLLDLLRQGLLAGAALDVFDVEPLPADHPFWTMPQVLVSPHMSGDLVGWRDEVVRMFAENLERWERGEPLAHVADLSQHPLET